MVDSSRDRSNFSQKKQGAGRKVHQEVINAGPKKKKRAIKIALSILFVFTKSCYFSLYQRFLLLLLWHSHQQNFGLDK
jgi:hypothetical protein